MTQAPPSQPHAEDPGPDARHRKEFGGWRDRGWHTITPPSPDAAHPLITLRVPLLGLDTPDTTRATRIAIARLQLPRAALSIEHDQLLIRCPPGEPPLDIIAGALAPLSVTLDLEHCRTLDARFTPLTISAPARPTPAVFRSLAAGTRFFREHVELSLALLGGLLLIAGFVVHLTDGPLWIRLALLGASAILTSTQTFPEAFESLLRFRVNIDQLMFAAAAGAAALGHYEEGAFLLFLFGLGTAGEHLALSRARSAINALASIAPDTALVVDDTDNTTTETPVENVAPGALVLVRPFDRIPLDAEVTEGRSAIDESTITGESIPVDKSPGDPVFAGTMNTDAAIRIRVTRPASESTLARVLRLVAEAQEGKSSTQLFTDRVERWYVPFVFIATAVVFLAGALIFHITWGRAFYNSMAFMTAASPCALAIGTPAAILCAVGRAARLGVLFKGGAYLDTLAQTRAIAYDKTGTLTAGTPTVTAILTADTIWQDELLTLAAAVESHITHPLADAITAHAAAHNLTLPPATDAAQIAGAGATATINGSTIAVLKPSAVPHDRWPAALIDSARSLADQGQTLVLVTRDEHPIGLIALADTIRPDAAPAIELLRTLGIERQIMLTGDNTAVARHIAELTHIDEIHAELLPEEKLDRIKDLIESHTSVAMVGDGVNDAPALAAASIGIAMGAAGGRTSQGASDAAIESADVALMGASLENLPRAILLSRTARSIIRQNVFIALAVITVVAPLGALGFANLGFAVLLHEGSTIVVVLNALRLLRFKADA